MKKTHRYLPLLLLLLFSCGTENEPDNLRPAQHKDFGMYEVYQMQELSGFFLAIDELSSTQDSLSNTNGTNGLIALLEPANQCEIALVHAANVAAVDSILQLDAAKELLPADVKFAWSVEPIETARGSQVPRYALYALRVADDGPRVKNKDIASTHAAIDPNMGQVIINIRMTEAGADKWEQMTRDNLNRCIAIVVNDRVYSCPMVMGVINGGQTQLSGNFTLPEAKELAAAIAP